MLSRSVIAYPAPSAPLAGTSRLHLRAAYTRCLLRGGAPRRPASGSELSLAIPSWHAVLSDPGELGHRTCPVSRCRHGPSPRSERLGAPNHPAIRFTRGTFSRLPWFTIATACQVARPPCTDLTGHAQPPGAFTSGLATGRSPSPSPDITTTATGLLCRRDFHPLEWQLASLHQIRTCGIPASGSHLGCLTAKRCCGQGWRIRGFGSQPSAIFAIRSHVAPSRWLRRRSARRH